MLEDLTEKEKIAIANRYRPLLVLYPEIESNSERKDHHHKDYGPGRPPLDQDYHPRGIGIVLDNVSLPGIKMKFRRMFQKIKMSASDILDAMSNNDVDRIDILKDAGPGDVAKFWGAYAAISQQEKDERYPRKAYARIVLGSGRYAGYLVVQYWLAYFFDDWANVHEMDWEMVSVVLKRANENVTPVGCAYGVHMGGFRLPWPEVEKVDDGKNPSEDGTHPVAYVANGSHASYFYYSPRHEAAAALLGRRLSQRITQIIPWIRRTFSDYVPSFAEGEKHFPEVEVIPDPDPQGHWHGDWRWLNFEGKWGSKGKFWLRPRKRLLGLPWEEDGPTGPNQKGVCWQYPFAWIDEKCYNAASWILSR